MTNSLIHFTRCGTHIFLDTYRRRDDKKNFGARSSLAAAGQPLDFLRLTAAVMPPNRIGTLHITGVFKSAWLV
jgi:hypothetical protein